MPSIVAYCKYHLTTIIVVFFCLVGITMIMVATSSNLISVTPDSVHYFAAAESFSAGRGLIDYDGTPFVVWPPLYPVILGLMKMGGLSLFWGARILNIVLFGVLIWQASNLAKTYFTSRITLAFYLLLLVCSGVLLLVAVFAWTELLFLVFCVLALWLLNRYLRQQNRLDLALLVLTVSLACLTRYIGVALVGTVMLFILFERKLLWRQRLISSIFVLFGSVIPLLIWIARNWMAAGTLFGVRGGNPHSLIDQLYSICEVLSSWVVVSFIPFWPRLVIAGMIFASISWFAWRIKSAGMRPAGPTTIFKVFIILYCVITIPLTITSTSQVVDERYLSIIYPFFLILFFINLEKIFFRLRHNPSCLTAFMLMLFLGSGMLVTRGMAIDSYGQTHEFGIYPAFPWRESMTAEKLASYPFLGSIYSNFPLRTYLITGHEVKSVPFQGEPLLSEMTEASSTARYLIWFEVPGEKSKPVYDIDWLKSHLPLIRQVAWPSENGFIGATVYTF